MQTESPQGPVEAQISRPTHHSASAAMGVFPEITNNFMNTFRYSDDNDVYGELNQILYLISIFIKHQNLESYHCYTRSCFTSIW